MAKRNRAVTGQNGGDPTDIPTAKNRITLVPPRGPERPAVPLAEQPTVTFKKSEHEKLLRSAFFKGLGKRGGNAKARSSEDDDGDDDDPSVSLMRLASQAQVERSRTIAKDLAVAQLPRPATGPDPRDVEIASLRQQVADARMMTALQQMQQGFDAKFAALEARLGNGHATGPDPLVGVIVAKLADRLVEKPDPDGEMRRFSAFEHVVDQRAKALSLPVETAMKGKELDARLTVASWNREDAHAEAAARERGAQASREQFESLLGKGLAQLEPFTKAASEGVGDFLRNRFSQPPAVQAVPTSNPPAPNARTSVQDQLASMSPEARQALRASMVEKGRVILAAIDAAEEAPQAPQGMPSGAPPSEPGPPEFHADTSYPPIPRVPPYESDEEDG